MKQELCTLGGYPHCFIETHIPMPEDYTCCCGLYVHPSRRNPKAIHISDCKYDLFNTNIECKGGKGV